MDATRASGDGPLTLADGSSTATLRKVYTSHGQFVEVAAGDGAAIYLDAIELESVTWQDRETLHAAFEDAPETDPDPVESGLSAAAVVDDPTLTVTNEYAQVRIGVPESSAPGYCVVVAPKLGYAIRLTATELCEVARLSHDVFSGFLEEPYGPA